MSLDNQGATDSSQQDNCPPAQLRYGHPQQHPLTFLLQNSATMANHVATPNFQAQYDGLGINTQDLTAGQTTRSTPRSSQNRAAFGKWKSKIIPGFPAADVPLPPGITATEIAESYPNHVSDHVILALMRQGKGAKAIDALIPAPPGKMKAGQSHSKIQLRISTIREAFPNEIFPITSTKRNRARSEVPKGETMSPEDEHAEFMTADGVSNSNYATAGDLDTRSPHAVATQSQDRAGYSKDTQNDSFMGVGSHWGPSLGGKLPLLSEAIGPTAYSTPELRRHAWSPRRTPLFEVQIKEEYQKHQQLLFNYLYANRPLPQLEMEQTVRSQCAATYDAISHKLQAQSGLALTKLILPSGWSEHSLSYLQRSITECFKGHPAFRTHLDVDAYEDQPAKRLETAVLQDLLGRLRDWTRYLETRLDNVRQTWNHMDLNAKATSNVNLGPNQGGLHSASSQTRAGGSARSLESDPSLPTFRRPTSVSAGSGTPKPGDASGDRARYLTAPSPQLGSLRKALTSEGSDALHLFQENDPKTLSRVPGNRSGEQCLSCQPDQDSAEVKGGVQSIISGPVSGLEDHTMIDALETIPDGVRHGFEDYMEEAGKFVNREARAADLPPLSGKQPPTVPLEVGFKLSPVLHKSSHQIRNGLLCRFIKI